MNEEYDFDLITDHYFTDAELILKVKYESATLDVPFHVLRKDVPLELARYIRNSVLEKRRGGYYNTWASKILKQHGRTIRRLHRFYNVSRTVSARRNREKRKTLSRNQRLAFDTNREKHGIKIPNTTRQALLLDIDNKDTMWGDSIAKEMNSLRNLGVFKHYDPNHVGSKDNDWQFASLRMLFDVKSEDPRRKSRLVIGDHTVDASKLVYGSGRIDSSITASSGSKRSYHYDSGCWQRILYSTWC